MVQKEHVELWNYNNGFGTSGKDDMVIIVGIEVSSKSQSKVNPLHFVRIVVDVVIKVDPTKSLWVVVVVLKTIVFNIINWDTRM